MLALGVMANEDVDLDFVEGEAVDDIETAAHAEDGNGQGGGPHVIGTPADKWEDPALVAYDDELAGVTDVDGRPKMMNPLDTMDGYTLLVTLLVINVVEFVAAIVFTANLVAGELNPDFGVGVWAIVGGVLSLLTVVLMLILKKCNETASVRTAPWLSLWLLMLWIAIVFPCTFQPPFAAFGNGCVLCCPALSICALSVSLPAGLLQ